MSAGESPDGLPPLRDVIRDHELRAKKSLGQNFLLDLNITRKIAKACGNLDDTTVIEVGPGPGGLTRALLLEGAAGVIAIERDDRCLAALEQISARYAGRLDVVPGDALETDWGRLRERRREAQTVVAANLPYAIATLLLVNWLLIEPWPPWYRRMVLMFQKEVAERITARPGSKAYGRLSVLAQWRCETSLLMTLPPEAFTPPPKVASAVVVFDPKACPLPCSAAALGRVTAAAFGQRRKMLRASLKSLTPLPELLLSKAGIVPTQRAEQLSVAEFVALARALEGEV